MEDDLLQFNEGLTEAKVTEKLKGYNDRWDKKSETFFPKLTAFYKFYRDQEYNLNGTAVKVPIVFTTIEIEKPHLLNNIFAQSAVVDAEPKFDDPDRVRTTRVKAYINSLLIDVCKGRKKTQYYLTNFLIYGFGIVKAYWNMTPDKEINPITKVMESVNSAHPDFYNVDPYSFAFDYDKQTTELNELDWVRERIFTTKSAMKEMRDNGLCGPFDDSDMTSTEDKGKKARNPNDDADKGTYYDEFYCRLWDKKPIMESRPAMHPETGEPLLDEAGQPQMEDVDTGETKVESKEYRIWFLANEKIIKFEENIFGRSPYSISSPYPVPFQIYGQGESEVIGGIANRLSLNNYQAGLLASKIGKSPYLIGPNSGLMPYNLTLLEEGVVFSKDINDVKPLPSIDPENLNAILKFGEYLQAEAEMVTGVTKFLQGTDIGNMTATQASLIAQNSTNRLATKLEQLQENYIVPLAEMLFLLAKQNEQAPKSFRDSNNNLINLEPEDFYGEYTWSSTSPVTISNKALSLQQNLSLVEMMGKASQASMNTPWPADVNYNVAMKSYIQPFTDISDISAVFVQRGAMPTSPMPPQGPNTSPMPAGQAPQAAGTPPQGNTPQPVAGNYPQVSSYPMEPAASIPHPSGPAIK